MKPITADMLRAHLMVASLTALAADALACITIAVAPAERYFFVSTEFRLLALAIVASGVVITRQLAHAAFELATRDRHARFASPRTSSVSIASDCPRCWLVVLHLRMTGKPFVVAGH